MTVNIGVIVAQLWNDIVSFGIYFAANAFYKA